MDNHKKGGCVISNYHFEVKNVSRGKSGSITRRVSYILGKKLRDNYLCQGCYHNRDDVLFGRVFLPRAAPSDYGNLQALCDAIDKAEHRYDARTAKEFIGALPNELSVDEIVKIVTEFIRENFTERGLAAIAAIHEGHNSADISRNNPHVHILVTTRTLNLNGFSRKKLRELDQKKNVGMWREHWAQLQNRAYERNGLEIRVSHESLEVQGIKREPLPHLPCIDFQREKHGERTEAGDRKREVLKKNKRLLEKGQQRDIEHEHSMMR